MACHGGPGTDIDKVSDHTVTRYLSYLRELEALEKSLSHMDHLESCYYKMSTLYYGISVTEKTIEWCRHIREGKVLKELTAK